MIRRRALALLAVLACVSAVANDSAQAKDVVTATTIDHAQRFGALRISIQIDLDDRKECELILDTNILTYLNAFGDMHSTTMFISPIKVPLAEVLVPDADRPGAKGHSILDPKDQGRRIYKLGYTDKKGTELHLVVPRSGTKKGYIRLLRVAENQPTRVLDSLELELDR